MLIFVYEWITGGGLAAETLPDSLVREGEMMLHALLRDLSELPDVDVIITRDRRLSRLHGNHRTLWVGSAAEHEARWDQAALQCDAVWPIAPETDDILLACCESIESRGKRLIGSSSAAVRICASKQHTIEILAKSGIPVVASRVLECGQLPTGDGPWVVKPDDGVGCIGAHMIKDYETLLRYCELKSGRGREILQPFIYGEPMSISMVCSNGNAELISVNRQIISVENESFRLLACEVNVTHNHDRECRVMASRIAAAIPELRGYVGVDFIQTTNGPRVLEINPRLTTSYAGLREATGINPARLVLTGALTHKSDASRCVVVDLETRRAR